MKKINLSKPLWIISILVITILCYSCKRDSSNSMSELNQVLIGKAKQYYQRETVSFESRNRRVLSAEKSGSESYGQLNFDPLWDEAAIETTSFGKKLVTVPILNFSLGTKASAYGRKIIFVIEGETIKEGQIVEVFSTPSEINSNGDKRLRDAADENMTGFTGAVMYYNLNYIFHEGRFYENGTARKGVAKLARGKSLIKGELALPASVNVAAGVGKLASAHARISAVTPEFEGQDCENYYLVYIERDEFGNIVYWENRGYQYTICKSTNPDSPNPGGSNVDVYVDCFGDVLGGAFYNSQCNQCVGGNTGIPSCPPKEVRDSVKNPCLKAQVNLATTAKTTILFMLNNTFGGTEIFEDLSLTFRDVTTLPDTIDAIERKLSGVEYEINLNRNKLPNASKEYILVTVYHEILHAFLDSKLTKGSNGYQNLAQHTQMASEYILLMTGALQVAFPGLSSQEAWALSWGGLQDTPFWSSLTPAQQNTIRDINSRHKDKTASNKLGTYCIP
ncbi:hypothetical protein ACQKCH_12670 [Nubsella zeaxanthinifaciens]|uniref:hypothetical protein n=1 Tax=Nubsella zeaxanthinifaciens TaxID=392412 RepID=UPI003D0288FF